MRLVLTILFALLGANALADTDPAPADERSPGDMTVEERTEMMKATNDYNSCVYQQAMGGGKDEPDIRRVADAALGACEPALETLRAKIRGWKFPEYFAEGFARTVRDRAARSVLPELAARKAN